MVVKSFLYYNYNDLRSFTSVSESAFDQLTMALTLWPFKFMFSRRGAFIELFIKKFWKKPIYSLIHRQDQGWIFYVRENSTEKMMKNGGRIIYLS